MRGRKPQVIRPGIPGDPIGPPPEYLTDTQQAVWTELLDVAPANVCTSTDRAVWEALVVAVDTFRIANDRLKTEGLVVPANEKSTYMVQNPYLIIRNKQTEIINKLAAQLGFDPTSRVRLKANTKPASVSKLAQLIARPA